MSKEIIELLVKLMDAHGPCMSVLIACGGDCEDGERPMNMILFVIIMIYYDILVVVVVQMPNNAYMIW